MIIVSNNYEAVCWILFEHFSLTLYMTRVWYYPDFADEETEADGGKRS